MKKIFLSSILGLAGSSAASHAATLSLDFQPTGGTTAAGHQAYEISSGQEFPAGGEDFNEFGATINVALSAANLEDEGSYRTVTRSGGGDITDVRNDWIGIDGRNTAGGNPEATFTITVSGLPAGIYSWTSLLHDGGTGTTGAGQGNISGNIRTIFTDADGTVNRVSMISSENPQQATSSFVTNFTSNGSPVSLTLGTTGTNGDAIFALSDSLEITSVPEPSVAVLGMWGLLALARRRR